MICAGCFLCRHLGSSNQTQTTAENEELQRPDFLVELAYLLDSDAKHLYDLMRMNTCLQEMILVFAEEVHVLIHCLTKIIILHSQLVVLL